MSSYINVDNVIFGYNENTVLNGISFNVEKGEFIAIVGANGCGKSTLTKLLSGLEFAKSGSITIDGDELTENNVDMIRKKIGIIFQNPDNQFVGVTVRDDIAFGLENACIERDEMISLIDIYSKLTNVNHLLDRSPEQLSGGEKQRVAIAGVLALSPEILILDEATAMLDPEGVSDVNRLIDELKGQKTIFNITHNLNEILFADRVMVINNGVVIAFDTPKNIMMGDALERAGLDLPDTIKVLKEVKKLNNKKVEEALWELVFKK